ncbi:hypothetical protein M5K25_009660 [Dendrobium thyrsiflorum]|uniref:Uncharacterized protein n=1 Tax=Dendrobium thyrsiflorum TaxID=117978 RepID=A0ABD0V6C5_DENTH
MSPDQGSEALLEGSNHNSDYQTISKLDDLIVESSGSTRQLQRAQEHRIPTSLSQKKPHFSLKNDPRTSLKESRERSKTALAPLLLLDHRRSSAEPPPDHHLKAIRSAEPPPDHHLKALRFAGPSPEGPTFHRITT